ncbi:MAG: adenosine deaminase [Saprospirales bacterium]|nr:adenosine deaminase [Saprospirales bacterium]
MDSKSLPKIELHLHLDCSVSYRVASLFEPGLPMADFEAHYVAPAKCLNLPDFLSRAAQGIRMTQTAAQLRAVTLDLFAQLQQENVRYFEVRFAPLEHLQQGLRPEEVVETVLASLEEGSKATGIRAGLIVCTLREYPAIQSLASAQLAVRYHGQGVVGFDMAGNEADYPIDAHVASFRLVCDQGLPCTAHAGEARGPESVWDSLRHFGISRIGHGVRSVEDLELVQYLVENNIHLEVCPTSNVQTNVYSTIEQHPVDQLYRAGVSIGINSDSRTLTNTTLEQEYNLLRAQFGWGLEELLQCNLNALEHAFLPAAEKAAIRDQLLLGYNKT